MNGITDASINIARQMDSFDDIHPEAVLTPVQSSCSLHRAPNRNRQRYKWIYFHRSPTLSHSLAIAGEYVCVAYICIISSFRYDGRHQQACVSFHHSPFSLQHILYRLSLILFCGDQRRLPLRLVRFPFVLFRPGCFVSIGNSRTTSDIAQMP